MQLIVSSIEDIDDQIDVKQNSYLAYFQTNQKK